MERGFLHPHRILTALISHSPFCSQDRIRTCTTGLILSHRRLPIAPPDYVGDEKSPVLCHNWMTYQIIPFSREQHKKSRSYYLNPCQKIGINHRPCTCSGASNPPLRFFYFGETGYSNNKNLSLSSSNFSTFRR